MKSSEQIKQEIVHSISTFQSPVRVVHCRASELMNEVLDEHPELLFYVKSFSGHAGMSGFEPCATYRLVYFNTDIPIDSIRRAENGAEIENELHSSIGRYQMALVLYIPTTIDTNKVYNDFMISYEGFYSNLLEISCETKSFPDSRFQYVVFRFRYRIGRVKLNMMERAVDEEVERLSRKLFSSEMSSETKAYVAHNYLAKTVEYWLKDGANPLEKSYMQSAYGALINHLCVCQGYAEAYKRLLDSQGIICEVICGKIRGSQEHHAWNVVSFDGKNYYHVDVTWDSHGDGRIDWRYFCNSDQQLNSTRIWTRRSGVICSSTENILAVARKQIASKKLTFLSKGIDKNYL